jgi:hypothetical protein
MIEFRHEQFERMEINLFARFVQEATRDNAKIYERISARAAAPAMRINCQNCAAPLKLEKTNCEYCGSINPVYSHARPPVFHDRANILCSLCGNDYFSFECPHIAGCDYPNTNLTGAK